MKALLTAAAVASLAASFPGLTLAQAAQYGINQQLDQLSAKIDREVGRGQLSQTQAVDALREVSSIEDAADAEREEHGGELEVANRLDLQARIDRLKAHILQERTNGPVAPTN